VREGLDLAAFIDSGVAMLGASADDDLVPEAFRVWGASWDDHLVRALISADAGRTLATVKPGTWLCLTFTDVMTLTSVQIKGRAVSGPEPPGPADVARLRRYGEQIVAAAAGRGIPRPLIEAVWPLAVFAVTVAVEEVYDQTPGPGAGGRLGERP